MDLHCKFVSSFDSRLFSRVEFVSAYSIEVISSLISFISIFVDDLDSSQVCDKNC
jgi:hypothetical protein